MWEQIHGRKREVCELLCGGYTNEEIANQLGIRVRTVKHYLHSCFLKFQIDGTRLCRIILAVQLTYDRHPELVPRTGLCAETGHTGRPTSTGAKARPIFYRKV